MAIVLPKFPSHRAPAGPTSGTQPAVNISLCREDGRYAASSNLKASWKVSRISVDKLQGVEVSVMWHTEGKGDEDLTVVQFHRYDAPELRRTGLADSREITCQLPPTPLSYCGHLMRINWCVRVRVFFADEREIMAEQIFCLVAPTIVTHELMSIADDVEPILPPPVSPRRFGDSLKKIWRRRDDTFSPHH